MQAVSRKNCIACLNTKRIDQIPLCRDDDKKRGLATDNDYATVARGFDEYVSLAEAAIFEYAFRLGAKLVMEVQTDEE